MKPSDTDTVPCRICELPTRMKGTKLCDRCWELEGRIHRDPAIAKRILDALTPAHPLVEPEQKE